MPYDHSTWILELGIHALIVLENIHTPDFTTDSALKPFTQHSITSKVLIQNYRALWDESLEVKRFIPALRSSHTHTLYFTSGRWKEKNQSEEQNKSQTHTDEHNFRIWIWDSIIWGNGAQQLNVKKQRWKWWREIISCASLRIIWGIWSHNDWISEHTLDESEDRADSELKNSSNRQIWKTRHLPWFEAFRMVEITKEKSRASEREAARQKVTLDHIL